MANDQTLANVHTTNTGKTCTSLNDMSYIFIARKEIVN